MCDGSVSVNSVVEREKVIPQSTSESHIKVSRVSTRNKNAPVSELGEKSTKNEKMVSPV